MRIGPAQCHAPRGRNPSSGRLRQPPSPARGEGELLSLRRHLDRAERRAAEAVGAVHVFRRRRRIDVEPRRDSAHDIGDAEERRLARLAVESGDEAVVAIFRMHRIDILLQPREGVDRAAVEQGRVVDLEAGGQAVDHQQLGVARLALGDLEHHHHALVLRDGLEVGLGSVELVERALERVALGGGGIMGDRHAGSGRHESAVALPALAIVISFWPSANRSTCDKSRLRPAVRRR